MKDQEYAGRQRRAFFRDAATRIIGPLADYIDERTATPRTHAWLRPPGAIEESQLTETCRRCGACVEACPAEARIFGDLSDPESAPSKALRQHGSIRLKEEAGTEPAVHYIRSYQAAKKAASA